MFAVWESKNPIIFGIGTSKETGKRLKTFGCRKVLCIYGSSVRASGIADPILKSIIDEGITCVPFHGVVADPPDTVVEEAAEIGRTEAVDGIVAIGGGSAMDIAKGVRVLLTFPSPISNYYCNYDTPPLDESQMKPLILLPTTAGTGSETSPGAVITDSVTNVKNIVNVSVSLGIVDPALTLGLGRELTAQTGMDALAHLIESLTSNLENRFCDVLGKEAISLIARNLPQACENPYDIAAREALSFAATAATVCVRGGFIHIPHGFGENMVSVWNIPHGVTVANYLPETMRFLAPVIPERIAMIASCLESVDTQHEEIQQACGGRSIVTSCPKLGNTQQCGADTSILGGADAEKIGERCAQRLLRLADAVGIAPFRKYIVSKNNMIAHIDAIIGTGELLHYSPREMDRNAAIAFVGRVYDGR